jgi:hemolysin activation/secretion protein
MRLQSLKNNILLSTTLLLALKSIAAPTGPGVLPSNFVPSSQLIGQGINFTDPGRASHELQKKLPFLPKVGGKSQIKTVQPAVTKASKLSFKLTNVTFVGNTVYPSQELYAIFAPHINKTISLGDLENLVHEITIKYREAGYILSRAILPPQVIKGGSVQVRVVEGFVSGFSVTGNPGRAKKLLYAYGSHIQASKPLQIHTLQRYTLLSNDLPGYTVESLLTPSPNVPAGADLTFVTSRVTHTEFISYDNLGTRFLGPQETTLGGSLYSLIAPGDSTNFRFTVTGRPQQLRYHEITHSMPVGSNGMRWQMSSNYAETRPGFVLKPALIVGRNFLIFTDLSYPWIRDRGRNLVTHGAFNYQNITSTILGFPFYQDRIRSLVLGFSFDNIDTFHGINSVSSDVTHGFNFWGASEHELQSRPNTGSIYTRINLSVSRTQALTQRFSLYIGTHAQYSFEALLATEQFGVGGPDIGRGYDPSEIVGDTGASGKVELRMDTTPGLKFLQSVQYYMFYDGGIILNKDSFNLPNQQSLTSTGLGARIVFMPNLTGNVYFGKPITRQVAVLTTLAENSTGGRMFFQFILSA